MPETVPGQKSDDTPGPAEDHNLHHRCDVSSLRPCCSASIQQHAGWSFDSKPVLAWRCHACGLFFAKLAQDNAKNVV